MEKEYSRFSEVISEEQEKAFPEIDFTVEVEDIMNTDIIIHDAVFMKSNQYGTDFAVVKGEYLDKEGVFFTFTIGAKVVVQRLKKAKEYNILPLVGKIVQRKNKNGTRKYMTIE